ncbi:unnamed protein product [Lactuca virosa]|uniref:Uncharacterized protein n=1 Tax=Lactuca virosa TaxID=75947 RepID=A0AAU9LT85_9ASTR|nr:unnamed protein product [Lactuca virosa]
MTTKPLLSPFLFTPPLSPTLAQAVIRFPARKLRFSDEKTPIFRHLQQRLFSGDTTSSLATSTTTPQPNRFPECFSCCLQTQHIAAFGDDPDSIDWIALFEKVLGARRGHVRDIEPKPSVADTSYSLNHGHRLSIAFCLLPTGCWLLLPHTLLQTAVSPHYCHKSHHHPPSPTVCSNNSDLRFNLSSPRELKFRCAFSLLQVVIASGSTNNSPKPNDVHLVLPPREDSPPPYLSFDISITVRAVTGDCVVQHRLHCLPILSIHEGFIFGCFIPQILPDFL